MPQTGGNCSHFSTVWTDDRFAPSRSFVVGRIRRFVVRHVNHWSAVCPEAYGDVRKFLSGGEWNLLDAGITFLFNEMRARDQQNPVAIGRMRIDPELAGLFRQVPLLLPTLAPVPRSKQRELRFFPVGNRYVQDLGVDGVDRHR